MEPEIAQAIVVAVTAVGAFVWMIALAVVVRAGRDRVGPSNLVGDRFEVDDGSMAAGAITGELEVEGDPEDLSTRLASQLARDNNSPFGPVKIVACDRHQIIFEPITRSQTSFRGCVIRLIPSGSRTRIRYAIDAPSRGLLVVAWIFLGLGLGALIIAPTLEFLFVLSSPNPNVRVQSIQTVQMIHFLWPPFLFAFLSRQPRRMFQAKLESLLNNLPYL